MARRNAVSVGAVLALALLLGFAAWGSRQDGGLLAWLGLGATGSGDVVAADAPTRPSGSSTQAGLPVVELATARAERVQDAAQAVGSLRSRQGVMLRPEVAGRVVQLNFADGQRVQRGQLLVQLDDRLARAQVQQARAGLGIAQSNHQRNQELVAQGFISARAADESAAALAVARAQLELAEAGAAQLALRAPFDGVVGIGRVHLGDMLQTGAEVAVLEDLDAMLLDFRLPERHQPLLRTGQLNTVRLDALPGQVFEAVVQAIDPVIDAEGRSVGVRACIDNRAGLLRPGMFARVHTALGERSDAVMVPEEAVVPLGGAFYVYVLDESAAQDDSARVQRRAVRLGARRDGRVELVSGLRAGQQLVVAGQQRLSAENARVRVAARDVQLQAPDPAAAQPVFDSDAQWHRAGGSGSPCAVPGR